MANRTTNTQAEALRGVLGNIADMKTMPDADIGYLTNLETMILGYLRAPFEASQQANGMSPAGNPSNPAMGGMPGAMPGIAPPGMGPSGPMMGGMPGGQPLAPPGPRVPGIMNGPSMPNPDELRRIFGK